ncbi:hypothetical protein RSAG8_03574, partial [Rhizoctonia solani AG-8 WAC10335]
MADFVYACLEEDLRV